MPTPCPTSARLKEVLAGGLAEAELAELTGHLDDCPHCQERIQDLAAGSGLWAACPAGRRRPKLETALERAMAALKDDTGPGERQADRADEGPGLDFLGPPDKPGQLGRLGPYAVTEVIGRGGMGVVLKALDPSLNRYVAIKVIAPQLATSAAARKRFAREARAAAAVSHEHVVAIHAVEEVNGLPYLVMEYVPGVSLQERLDGDGPLELKEILRIGVQTAAGLAAAHAQGLVHRDIKPANILLENCIERVKLTDFGLARTVDDASLTQSGVLAGTPQYMAPEQARGEAQDHRVDLFSLGSVLYTLCTGHPPFRASTTMAVLRRVSDEMPRPIRQINPEIPDWLAAIIARLHAKDPADRFQSAAEVAALLGQHLAHLQQPQLVPLPQPPREPAAARAAFRSRGRRWATAAAVVLCLLGGLTVSEATGGTDLTQLVATILRIRTPDGTLKVEIEDPQVKVNVDEDGKEITITGAGIHEIKLRPGQHRWQATKEGVPIDGDVVTISRGGKQVVKVSREADKQAIATGRGPQPELRQESISSPPVLPSAPILPNPPIFLNQKRDGALPQKDQPQLYQNLYSLHRPDQRDGGPAERPGLQVFRLNHPAPVWCLAFSPDGQTLATGSQDPVIRLWQLPLAADPTQAARKPGPGGEGAVILRTQIAVNDGGVFSVAFSPDGKLLASGGREAVRLWQAATGQAVAHFGGNLGKVAVVRFSPDGRTLVSGEDAAILLLDVASYKPVCRIQERGNRNCVGCHGQSHAAGVQDGELFWGGKMIWGHKCMSCHAALPPSKPLGRITGHQGLVRSLAFSPDGRSLASGSHDRTVRLWDVATGREIRRFPGPEGPVFSVAFSPDGKLLASAGEDEAVRLWDVASGKELRRLQGQPGSATPGAFSPVAFSPDGKLLASGDKGSTVHVWDVATGRVVLQLKEPGRVNALAFSPDGRLLAVASRANEVTLWSLTAPAPRKEEVKAPEPPPAIEVVVRQESGKPVIRVNGSATDLARLPDLLTRLARTKREVLVLDAASNVEWGTVTAIEDAAKRVGIPRVYFAERSPRAGAPSR